MKRLLSIDLLRGLTVMLMIFVNNGAGDSIFHTLTHSRWNGMTLADCVFPSFLFIMGMSTYLSLRKYQFTWSRTVARKITKRGFLLFLIGLALNWLDNALDGRAFDFGHLRLWGVMQRLGICYFLTAALALSMPRTIKKNISYGFIPIIIGGLIAYAAILLLGHGYDYDAATNLLARVDTTLFGQDHLYHKSPVDPEGLVSTLPATLHCMIGFVVMELLDQAKTLTKKVQTLLSVAIVCCLVGAILVHWLPVNKRVWSPTYVLFTIALCSVCLALLMVAIDRKPAAATGPDRYRWLKSFGMNPLALYVGSEALASLFGATGLKETLYQAIHTVVTDASWAGFCYATLFTSLFAVIGAILYRKKIFIKL